MKNTLKKALDELNKENPRIDYVRGILEVLIDNDVAPSYVPPLNISSIKPTITAPIGPNITESLPEIKGEPVFRSRK